MGVNLEIFIHFSNLQSKPMVCHYNKIVIITNCLKIIIQNPELLYVKITFNNISYQSLFSNKKYTCCYNSNKHKTNWKSILFMETLILPNFLKDIGVQYQSSVTHINL